MQRRALRRSARSAPVSRGRRYDIFRREITIKGSFAEIASFPSAVAALRSGRVRTDGPITQRYGLGAYGRALDDFSNDESLHKAAVSPVG